MAITLRQWEKMEPDQHKIVDFTGITWEVISKLSGELYPTFVLKAPGYPAEIFSFAPEHGQGEKMTIVDQEFRPEDILNNEGTNIVAK